MRNMARVVLCATVALLNRISGYIARACCLCLPPYCCYFTTRFMTQVLPVTELLAGFDKRSCDGDLAITTAGHMVIVMT